MDVKLFVLTRKLVAFLKDEVVPAWELLVLA